MFYQSGEQIERGDKVRLHDEPGTIESVHDAQADPSDWYVENFGDCVMIVAPKVFGRVFLHVPIDQDEDLEFVSRGS